MTKAWERILERYAVEPTCLGKASAVPGSDFEATILASPDDFIKYLRNLKIELRLVLEYTNYAIHIHQDGSTRLESHNYPALGPSGLDMRQPTTLAAETGILGMRSRGFHMKPYQ